MNVVHFLTIKWTCKCKQTDGDNHTQFICALARLNRIPRTISNRRGKTNNS